MPEIILPDQNARDRFKNEADRNFSVRASAGAGKTTAIVRRIVHIALNDRHRAKPLLPRLVVVTYTKKAALEMQDRARLALIEANAEPEVMAQLRKAFFGTIHSFCHDLVREYAFTFGITSTLEMGERDDLLWREFMQEAGRPSIIPEAVWNGLRRHVRFADLLALAKKIPVEPKANEEPLARPPLLNGARLLAMPPNKKSKGGVEEGQQLFQEWMERYEQGNEFLPLPSYSKGGSEFQAVWSETFEPLYNWLNKAATIVAQALAQAYRAHRLAKGRAIFDDLLDLAAMLVRDPVVGRKLRERQLVILLDEAQDTDPRQFLILTELARAESAHGLWLENGTEPPEPGRFSMVGDPQQSIYSERADNEFYLGVHERLTAAHAGEALVFNVTMRCASAIVKGVNHVFPHLFARHDGRDSAAYNPLVARPDAQSGNLVRISLQPDPDAPESLDSDQLAARAFAQWLCKKCPADFHAEHWNQVAILCPRNDWLLWISRALDAVGMASHVLSVSSIHGDDPVYAWAAGLFAVLANPVDSFELTGVLREIFGISDHELAVFVRTRRTAGMWHPLQLLDPVDDAGPLGIALDLLRKLRFKILDLPLHNAVETIFQTVHLEQRLSSLGLVPEEWIQNSLDALRVQSIAAEADRATLEDFAQLLRRGFAEKFEPAAAPRDAVALLSCQKAKGLEWEAVIIPFLNRDVSFPSMPFPRFYHDYGRCPPQVFIQGSNDSALAGTRKRKLDDELDRILYVAMTRAKQLLVLIDDSAFFGKHSAVKQTFCKRLLIDVGEPNYNWWQNLPSAMPEPLEPITDAFEETTYALADAIIEVPFSNILDVAQATQERSWKRILPSALALHHSSEVLSAETQLGGDFPEELGFMDPAAYGNWWHAVMEQLPWSSGREACWAFAQKLISSSPDEPRAIKELEAFFSSSMADELIAGDWVVVTEVPLFWRRDVNEVVEGIIDLLAYRLDKSQWLLLDWKTDRIAAADPGRELVERYSPQIGLYAQALNAIHGKPIKACIYATALSQTLPIK